MLNEGRVTELAIFTEKGKAGIKKEKATCLLDDGKGGLEGDFHFGNGERQMSLLADETKQWMEQQTVKGLCFDRYKANIVVEGCGQELWQEGTVIAVGEAILEITDRSKKCFAECKRYVNNLECRLRQGCCYAKAVSGGMVAVGDRVRVITLGKSDCKQEAYNWKRYARQMSIELLGEKGQERLKEGTVLVVGAGGLGCPAITALAEAGIGKLGIVDCDVVDETNLNRQFLYTPDDIGRSKAGCAVRWVERFRPDIKAVCHECKLESENAAEIIKNYDFVVIAVDNVNTRMIINRVSKSLRIPFVDGAIDGFYGTVISVLDESSPCLACVNPQGREPEKKASSLGTTTMVIGALEAQCAVMYLAGIPVKSGVMLSYDGIYGTLEEVPVVKNPDCEVCGMVAK